MSVGPRSPRSSSGLSARPPTATRSCRLRRRCLSGSAATPQPPAPRCAARRRVAPVVDTRPDLRRGPPAHLGDAGGGGPDWALHLLLQLWPYQAPYPIPGVLVPTAAPASSGIRVPLCARGLGRR